MPGEITRGHLNKKACIYIRQSSPHQVQQHRESQALQYRLTERAQALGWVKEKIVVFDSDLGISATGTKKRSDFEEMLSDLCLGDIGAIFLTIASRLARNGHEWHKALEFCSIVGTLIIDNDGIYDPRLPSDRLWLGMKGSFSEYEVGQFQAYVQAAIRNKASRGELIHFLPAGLIATGDGRIELDPDRRVQQAIRAIFAKFDELGSVRQVCKWYQRQGMEVPVRDVTNACRITWRVPVYSTIYHVLTNPFLAGTYLYPRTKTIKRIRDGRLEKSAGHRIDPEDKIFLFPNLFVGYISWEKYQQNQKIIADNANMKGDMVRGAAREGKSLLAGLIRCGHCGRKVQVRYPRGQATPYYYCQGASSLTASRGCLSFSGQALEEVVRREIIAVVQPVALEAAMLAEKQLQQDRQQKSDALALAIEQAKYEANRIDRQLRVVEPENTLVSRELMARWQTALEKVETLEQEHKLLLAEHQPISEDERNRLFELAKDLDRVWNHPQTDSKTKARLARLLIHDIWVKTLGEDKITATIHWQGGVHTEIELKRPRRGQRQHHVKEQPVDLIKRLALVCDDQHLARILNRLQHKTAAGQTWTEAEVVEYRRANKIPAFSKTQYDERGLINLSQAVEILAISPNSVMQLIKCGLIKATQVIKHAPWEIPRTELDKLAVRRAAASLKAGKQIPFHENQQQLNF
jgi:DNA invertase Pin-like site-specific DNA recombinase